MNDLPIVSVIMSVYNGECYLQNAMDSIMVQTFQNFEFIIVDDFSTDSTLKIIKQYKDKRIRLICNKTNIGLTKNLNKALKASKGKYIARMDADDISYPNRLEEQVKFLDTHKEVYLISCSYREFGNRFQKNYINLNENEIKAQYLFGSVLPHPGFMFRKEVFNKYHIFYNSKLKYAQDYDFQVRVSKKFHIACLPQFLIYYRISSEQISASKIQEQRICANKVRLRIFKDYGVKCNRKQIEILSRVYSGENFLTLSEYIELLRLFFSVYKTINKSNNVEFQYIIKKMMDYMRQVKGVKINEKYYFNFTKFFRGNGCR